MSADKRTLAVPARWRRPLILAGVLVLLALAYGLGAHHSDSSRALGVDVEQALERAENELAILRQELINREVGGQVDTASLEAMRQLVADLHAQLAQREEELSLYRSLLDDQEGTAGLQVESMGLRKTPAADSYQYRIVVRRRADPSAEVEVSVALAIEGQRGDEPLSIPFNEADLSLPDDALTVRFKYFKVLRGTFVLPADFAPAKVVLTVMEKNAPSTLRVVDFPWQVTDF